MPFILRVFLFLLLNFGALALGGLFTKCGVSSEWYETLNKAPWTPPGWFFGFAWTVIMITFSIYLAYLWPLADNKKVLILLYALQWLLNVSWNPVFFALKNPVFGAIIISLLTLVVLAFLIFYFPLLKYKSLLLLPYLLWIITATSLNIYILVNN